MREVKIVLVTSTKRPDSAKGASGGEFKEGARIEGLYRAYKRLQGFRKCPLPNSPSVMIQALCVEPALCSH